MDTGLGLLQPARAYGYVRVSTAEQAEHKTSVKQQEADIRAYCETHGIDLIEVFVEPGLSGSDWSRPEFNRMLLLATGDDRPVDAIIACDMARLARDVEFTVTTQGQLQRAGVRSLFVYQKFEDSHFGLLHKLLTSWQDQDAIVKASMNTRRGLRGTAEEGFWVGGTVPLGYESRTVEIRSKKEKKKLFIKEDEAAVVRLIFDLGERGLNGEPMGGRAIADYLNSHGYTRRGKPFYNATLAKILSTRITSGDSQATSTIPTATSCRRTNGPGWIVRRSLSGSSLSASLHFVPSALLATRRRG